MSEATAIVLFAPIEPRLLPKLSRRYRAGIVMESLEVRRVLSVAVAAVELPDEPLDDSAIFIDAGACEAGTGEAGDPKMYELMFTTTAGDDAVDGEVVVDDDVAWPDGWGWSEDRLPTQEEIDAANNGDDLGGLWIPVRTFGDGEDDLWTDDEEWVDDGEIWTVDDSGDDETWTDEDWSNEAWSDDGEWVDEGEWTDDGEVWTLDGDMIDDTVEVPLWKFDDNGGFVGHPVLYFSRGNLPNERTLEVESTAAAAGDKGAQDPAAEQAAGGAPAPIIFGTAASADGLLLGKLKQSVTGDEESDLPFMN